MKLLKTESRKPTITVELNKVSSAMKRTLRLQLRELIHEIDEAAETQIVKKLIPQPLCTLPGPAPLG